MTAAKTAAELGLMTGVPPFRGEGLVWLGNWEYSPHNRWGFQHVRELIPTANISRGLEEPWGIPRAERDLDDFTVDVGRRTVAFREFLDETFTDGIIVLHRGHVVTERYLNGMRSDTRHLLMSVSKSVTSATCGSLVEAGQLSPDDLVTTHIPELSGTSWDGCTVRHLLDMRAGTRFNEDYDDPEAEVRVYEQIYLWQPRTDPTLPDDITDYFPMLENKGPHGGPFDYRSVLTDMLAWVMERASGVRLPALISRHLWQPMGASFDADITVDAHGNAMADGGICTTLSDLARFGQVLLDDGRRGDTQVIPRTWLRDTLTPDPDTRSAFEASEDRHEFPPTAYYRNQFWVIDPEARIFQCSGINGQTVFVHGPSNVVIAKFSTWPDAWTPRFSTTTRLGLTSIAEQVAGLAR
jgi:CubicO group peptidase (beta-lactamase class C family)